MDKLLTDPDIGLMIWTWVCFAIMAGILAKFAWGPMVKAMEAREHRIKDDLAKAEGARKEAEATLARHAAALNQVKAEAQAILEEGKADAVRLKERILQEAREEAGKVAERARHEIELAKDKAVSDLQAQAASLSVAMASKILGREVKVADQDRLIQESLGEFKRQGMN